MTSKFDEWEADPASPTGKKNRLEGLAEELLSVRARYEALKDTIETIEAELASHTPEEPGEHTYSAGRAHITVRRGETWKWDQDAIEAKVATVPPPSFIEHKFVIKRSAFEKLPPCEQKEWLHALTRTPGKPRISITIDDVDPIIDGGGFGV